MSYASPVNDERRATPGTIERAMRQLDDVYAGDKAWTPAIREQVKYRLQGVIDLTNKGGKAPIVKRDAVNLADEVVHPSYVQGKPTAAGRKRIAANVKASEAEAGKRVDRYAQDRQDAGPQEGESLWDAIARFSDEDHSKVPGLRTPAVDRFLQAMRTVQTPDPSATLESAGKAVAGDIGGVVGRKVGKAAKGAMGVFNVPANLAMAGDVADLAARNLGPQEDLPKGKDGKPLSILQQVAGEDPQAQTDFLAELLGGLAGGKLAHVGGEIAGRRLPSGVRRSPVTEAPEPIAPKLEDPVVPETATPPDPVTTPKAQPETVAPAAKKGGNPVANPQRGKRPALAAAIDEATAPRADERASLGKGTVRTPDGATKVDVEFRVVDRSQLKASHDLEGRASADYPSFVQPRDRSLPGERAKIRDQAKGLDPDLLTDDFKATDRGAPLVGSDGVVESGNGRVLSIDQAKRDFPERYAAYQDSVRRMAKERGVDVSHIQDPVLIQERLGPLDDVTRRTIAGASNEGSSSAMSLAEISRGDVDRLPKDLASRFNPHGRTLEDALSHADNQGIVRQFADSLPASERASMFDGRGGFSEPGRQRVGRAMVAHALGEGSHDVLLRIQQDGDFSARVSSGLEQSSPSLLSLRESADGGNAIAKGMLDSMTQALRDVDAAKGSGRGSAWFEEGSLFERDTDALRIGKMLHDAKSAKQVAETVRHLSEAASNADGGMFGDELAYRNVTEAVDSVFGDRVIAPDASGTVDAKASATKLRQVHTPEFSNWFGESKITDAQGSPKRVYHGTTSREIEAFDPSRIGSGVDGGKVGDLGPGFYFTEDAQAADRYARPGHFMKAFDERAPDAEGSILPLYARAEKPLVLDPKAEGIQGELSREHHSVWDAKDDAAKLAWHDKVREAGYDSVLSLDGEGKIREGVVFEPNQLKSATGNSGRFSRGDVRLTGAADVKTLAVIGGAAALTTAGVALYGRQLSKWYKENGLSGVAEAGAIGVGAIGLMFAARKGKLSLTTDPKGFAIAQALLDPAELARRAAQGGGAVERLFGEGADALMSAKAEHTYRTADSMGQIGKAAENAFGSKKWLESNAFREGNATVRDTMEINLAEGREWHVGLSKEWKAFVESVIPVMDSVIDDFEDLGGRIRVKNDGSQHLKLNPGDSVRVQGGRFGTYEGYEMPPAGDPSDPFSRAGGFGTRGATDVNANARAARNIRLPADASEPVPTLKVRMEDGSLVEIGPNQVFGRPVDRIGQAFVPRVFKDAFVKTLKTLDSAPEGYRTALEAMLEKANPDLGLSGDAMMGKLGDLAAGAEETDGGIASFLANLERERVMELAKFEWTDAKGETHTVDPYESSYIDSVAKYVDKGWKRVAVARQFGPNPDALGGALKIVKSRNQAYGVYLEKLLGRVLGIGPERPVTDDLAAGFARGEGSYQTISKLTGGTTHVAQLNDALFATTRAGLPKTAAAVWDLAFSKDRATIRAEADVMAAVHEQWYSDLRNGGSDPTFQRSPIKRLPKGVKQTFTRGETSQGLATMADAIMTGIGIQGMDRAMKRLAVVTGLRDAAGALDAAVAATKAGKEVSGEVARKLAMYGVEGRVEAAAKVGGRAAIESHPETVQSFAANVRSQLTYSGAAQDLPLWMSTPAGSVLARFKKPLYVSTRLLLRDVVGELAKGNVKPAARFLAYGSAGGAVATYLKDAVRGKGFDEETRALFHKGDYLGGLQRFFALPAQDAVPVRAAQLIADRLRGKDASADLMGLLGAAGKNLYDSGLTGVAGEVSPYNRRLQDLTGNPTPDVWKAAMPTIVGEIFEDSRRVVGGYKKIGSFNNAVYGSEGAKADYASQESKAAWFEALRSSLSPVRRITDWTGLKPEVTQLHDLESRVNRGEKLGPEEERRYLDLMETLKGRFQEMVNEDADLKDPSYKSELLDDGGLSSSGVPMKRRGGKPRR